MNIVIPSRNFDLKRKGLRNVNTLTSRKNVVIVNNLPEYFVPLATLNNFFFLKGE